VIAATHRSVCISTDAQSCAYHAISPPPVGDGLFLLTKPARRQAYVALCKQTYAIRGSALQGASKAMAAQIDDSCVNSGGYSIAAIPTVYRGRRYRSRLEARWAAFFDLLGWQHEYEPFDLGSWSPDFLLTEWNTLVEIKPITEFDRATWNRLVNTCRERGRDQQIFLSRLAPEVDEVCWLGWFCRPPNYAAERCWLGWYGDPCRPFSDGMFQGKSGKIVSFDDAGWFSANGDSSPWHMPYPDECTEWSSELWAKATGAVRWQPEGRP
jgi:hypothetical protein